MVGDPDTFDLHTSLKGSCSKGNVIMCEHGIPLGILHFLVSFGGCISARPPLLKLQDERGSNEHEYLRNLSVNLSWITGGLVAREGAPEPAKMRCQWMAIFLGGEVWLYQSQLLPQCPANPECHVKFRVVASAETTLGVGVALISRRVHLNRRWTG